MFYNTEDLVTAAKRSEFFPISQATFTDPDDFIAFANEELQLKMGPKIMSARADFFLTYLDVSIAANIARYPIPERAYGNALKDVQYLQSSSNQLNRYSLPKIDIHDLAQFSASNGVPSCYYIEGDEICLSPTPSSATGTLRFYYYTRPSKIVPTSSCAKITAIATVSGTTTFTVNTDLTASLSVGSKADFLCVKSPFRLWAMDVVITAITSTTIAVAQTGVLDESLTSVAPLVNDYICPAQQSCIPMIPQEFHPILAEMICYRSMKAIGAQQNVSNILANVSEMLQDALLLIANRVEAQVDTVYTTNGFLDSMGSQGASFRF